MIEAGQVRNWIARRMPNSHSTFMVIEKRPEREGEHPKWNVLYPSGPSWHYHATIESHSEVISDAG